MIGWYAVGGDLQRGATGATAFAGCEPHLVCQPRGAPLKNSSGTSCNICKKSIIKFQVVSFLVLKRITIAVNSHFLSKSLKIETSEEK
jgi:hypothetical protein